MAQWAGSTLALHAEGLGSIPKGVKKLQNYAQRNVEKKLSEPFGYFKKHQSGAGSNK